MTLIALTQEPEVKVRLAMIGKWCGKDCIMSRDIGDDYGCGGTECVLYPSESEYGGTDTLVYDVSVRLNERSAACIAAHGGADDAE